MRMTEPLPNWRSIWVRAPCRAVSLAFAGSWILMPSTLGRGSDRTQHANVTKACRLCAKSAEGRVAGRLNREHTVCRLWMVVSASAGRGVCPGVPVRTVAGHTPTDAPTRTVGSGRLERTRGCSWSRVQAAAGVDSGFATTWAIRASLEAVIGGRRNRADLRVLVPG